MVVVSRSCCWRHVERSVSSRGWRESLKQKNSIVLQEEQVSSQHDPSARLLFGLEKKLRE